MTPAATGATIQALGSPLASALAGPSRGASSIRLAAADRPKNATVTATIRTAAATGGQPARDDLELAAEDPERRQRRQREDRQQEQRPAPRQQVQTSGRGDPLAAELADQHARAHERIALRRGVRE